MALELLLSTRVFFLGFTYFGYPLTLWILSALRNRPPQSTEHPFTPSVTLLIAAYNEEAHIRETVLNKIGLDYPEGLLKVVVVSDASTDGTDKICRELAAAFPNVRFIRQEERRGKTAALNRALPLVRGEILVFSDANSLYAPDALRHLVKHFANGTVGYVTGRLVYGTRNGSLVEEGCGAYMRYENVIRILESRIGSVVGATGGIDAIRRELYEPLREDLLSDFVAPLKVVEKGYRVIFERRAVLREEALSDPFREFKMRVRVIVRTLHALRTMKGLLNGFRYPLFAYQLFTHKVLRYLIPEGLILLYGTNLWLIPQHYFYFGMFLLQTAFYFAAIVGYALQIRGVHSRLSYIPFYFCLVNLAALKALPDYLLGRRCVTWQPRTGN